MAEYHIEQSRSIPRFKTFVSHLAAFPIAISFPERLYEELHWPIHGNDAAVEFHGNDGRPIAVSRWSGLHEEFRRGSRDFVWLAKMEMRRLFYDRQYRVPSRASYISDALPDALRVTWSYSASQHEGQRIFFQHHHFPREVFFTILLDPYTEVTDAELNQTLMSFRWL